MTRATAALRARAGDDSGMTLVELLVYCVLMLLVVSIVGSTLVQTMWVQHHITGTNEANNHAQVQLSAMELGVRNASEVRVSPNGRLLVVKRRSTTAANTSAAICSGWYLDPAGGLRGITQAATGTPVTVAAVANPSAATSWPLLVENAAAPASGNAFAASGSKVSIAMQVATTRNRPPVTFRTQAAQRDPGSSLGGVSCW